MMKTLASSCSKPTINKDRDRGFPCFQHLSLSRPPVCLSPSKQLVKIRFLHLASVQYRRLRPVFSASLSPDLQVDLETSETQHEEENPSKTIHVKFQLQKECSFGEHFFLAGDHPMLGLWDPDSSIPMTWSEGHVWAVELDIPVGISIQFKFILKTTTGDLLWQPGPDRIFKSSKTENMIIVSEDWEAADYQKIIEEEPLLNQNGPLIIDSEKLTPLKEELVSDINLLSDIGNTSITSPGKQPLQALPEELATGNSVPSLEKPVAIVAENTGYPTEDSMSNKNKQALDLNDEALAISNKNVLVAENLGDGSKVETVQSDVEGNMVIHEGSPVLVPDLTPLSTVATEEEMSNDDEKNTTSDKSIGVDEAKCHELSEVMA